jgi:hypothetical protein
MQAMGGNAIKCSADAFAAAHKQKVVMPMSAVLIANALPYQCGEWYRLPAWFSFFCCNAF